MALVVNKPMTGKRCWACGLDIRDDEATVLTTGVRDLLYLHLHCAQSVSQQLLRDISQAIDLGYDTDDE